MKITVDCKTESSNSKADARRSRWVCGQWPFFGKMQTRLKASQKDYTISPPPCGSLGPVALGVKV